MSQERTYLDNAATSWPKPERVYAAVDRYQREIGVAAGRGSYRCSEEVARTILRLRKNLLKVVGATTATPEHCIFTQNSTEALNLAIHGLLRPGDHVVFTDVEHNSVTRPITSLTPKGVQATSVPVSANGTVDLDQLRAAVTPYTKLVAVTHASNVTGAIQPLADVSSIAKAQGALLLVDAAQTLGHATIDVDALSIDLLAAPGHKGLLGPLGTGFLYISPNVNSRELSELRQGGTGTSSELLEQPESLPEKYEAGNANVPGLFGLDAGVQFVLEQSNSADINLTEISGELIDGLGQIADVEIYSAANPCGIVSFNVGGLDPREVAMMLDSSAGIEVRAGLHCAPGTHHWLGTFERGGCLRASFGHFSTSSDATKLLQAIEVLAAIDI